MVVVLNMELTVLKIEYQIKKYFWFQVNKKKHFFAAASAAAVVVVVVALQSC